MASQPINPTQLTPPRVALIDDRTGAISREWYRFFLSLLTATQSNDQTSSSAPDTNSLMATYDAMLASLAQEVQTTPADLTGSLQSQLDNLYNATFVAPRSELGTLAALQQDNVPWLSFDTTPSGVPPTIGTVFWDGGQTLNIQQTLNVAGKTNEDNFYYIKATGAITKGQLVMFTGAVGSSGVLTGAPAAGLGINDGIRLMGIAAENIALNGFGMVQWSGTLRGFNTTGTPYGETWADGDILYYNPAYSGGLTKVEPTAPNVRAVVAAVINASRAGAGSIVIRLSVGSVLGGTDSNVYINALTGNDLLIYDGTDQRWENRAASAITVGTATNLAGGLANQLAYQTAPGTTGFATVGTGLSLSGGTLINSAPDQIVSLTGAGTTVVTGTYPNFTITSNDQYTGTVTSVAASGGTTGLTFSGSPITTSGTLTLGGTLGVANGGTGATSLTAGYLTKGNGTSAVSASIAYDDGTNLGVGTASPGAKLDVSGNIRLSAANPFIELNNGGPLVYVPGVVNTLAFATGGGIGSPVERFRIGSAGQWGIGGATYGTAGQVFTSGGPSAAPTWTTPTTGTVTSVSGTGSVNGITLTGTVTSSGSLTLGGTLSGVSLTTQVSGTLPVANGGTGVTTSTGSGSVVLSTSPSLTTPTIGAATATSITNGAGSVSAPSYTFTGDTNTGVWSPGADTIAFSEGGVEAMRVNSNAKLLVGTTAETAASVTGLVQVQSEVFSKGSLAGFFFENRSGGVTSNSNWYGWYNSGGTTYFYNPAVGNIASINSATGAYTALSDERLKSNIAPSPFGLDTIKALRPVTYTIGDEDQLGFLAQEAGEALPYALVDTGEFIGLSDRPIIAALVKAVQDLAAQVEELKNAG